MDRAERAGNGHGSPAPPVPAADPDPRPQLSAADLAAQLANMAGATNETLALAASRSKCLSDRVLSPNSVISYTGAMARAARFYAEDYPGALSPLFVAKALEAIEPDSSKRADLAQFFANASDVQQQAISSGRSVAQVSIQNAQQVICDISRPQWRDIITATGIPASIATVTRFDAVEKQLGCVWSQLGSLSTSVNSLCQLMALQPAASVTHEFEERLKRLLEEGFAAGFKEGVKYAVMEAFEQSRQRDMQMIEDIVARQVQQLELRLTGGAVGQHAVGGGRGAPSASSRSRHAAGHVPFNRAVEEGDEDSDEDETRHRRVQHFNPHEPNAKFHLEYQPLAHIDMKQYLELMMFESRWCHPTKPIDYIMPPHYNVPTSVFRHEINKKSLNKSLHARMCEAQKMFLMILEDAINVGRLPDTITDPATWNQNIKRELVDFCRVLISDKTKGGSKRDRLSQFKLATYVRNYLQGQNVGDLVPHRKKADIGTKRKRAK